MEDLLERLTQLKVPPAPTTLKRDVHDRLNRTLLVQQIVGLATNGAVYACGHLLRGLLGLVAYTLTGKFPVDRGDRSDHTSDA